MELNRDFSEFITSCAAHNIRLIIVGGYGVAAHGHPRFTKGLDVWVWVDEQNGGQRLPFISVEDLLANKMASGRPEDLADAVTIEELSDADDQTTAF